MKAAKWKGSPYVVAALAFMIASPLFREFGADAPTGLKIFIGVLLLVVIVVAFLLSRYLASHMDEVGEAIFDTTNAGERNGR